MHGRRAARGVDPTRAPERGVISTPEMRRVAAAQKEYADARARGVVKFVGPREIGLAPPPAYVHECSALLWRLMLAGAIGRRIP